MAEILATYEYTLINNNTEYSINKCTNKSTCTKAVIPSEYNNLPVTQIGISVFSSCASLTSIEIPSSVTSINSSAFYYCKALTKVNYTGTIDQWVQIKFNGSSANPLDYAKNLYINNELVTNVVLTSTTNINSYVFSNCTSITSVVIPDSVTSISDRAFYYCTALTSVTFGENSQLTSIGEYAFQRCYNLVSIVIPNSVTTIGYRTFFECSKLTHVTLPNSLKTLGYRIFQSCSILECNIKDNLKYIGSNENPYLYLVGTTSTDIASATVDDDCVFVDDYVFSSHIALTTVTIGSAVIDIGPNTFKSCSKLITINVNSQNSKYKAINGILYSKGESVLIQYPIGKQDAVFVVPDRVKTIDDYAFYECLNILEVKVGENSQLTSISDYAFYGCTALEAIEIPASVTSIGYQAFRGCSSLTSIEIPASVTSIGDYAFYNCTSLTSIVIPDSITSIGSQTFYRCYSLTSVIIGSSVTSIANQVFEECTNLQIIYLLGTAPVTISAFTFDKCRALEKIYCFKAVLELYKNKLYWSEHLDKFIGDDLAIYFALNASSQKSYFASKKELNSKIEQISNNSSITIDTELSDTSTNSVQNKVIKEELDKKIDDVQINKVSIVSNGVATIPLASGSNFGVVKTYSGYGIQTGTSGALKGYLLASKATEAEIDAKKQTYKSIVPSTLDYAVKVSITTNKNALTNNEQVSVQKWLGLNSTIEDEFFNNLYIQD